MHDIVNNVLFLPYFSIATNDKLHSHNTHNAINIHIESLSLLQYRNFINHSILFCNKCPIKIRELSMSAFCAHLYN